MTKLLITLIILALVDCHLCTQPTNYISDVEQIQTMSGLNGEFKIDYCILPINQNLPTNILIINNTNFYNYEYYDTIPNPDYSNALIPNGEIYGKLVNIDAFHGYNYTFWMDIGVQLVTQEWQHQFLFNYISGKTLTYQFNSDYEFTVLIQDGLGAGGTVAHSVNCNNQRVTVAAPPKGADYRTYLKNVDCKEYSIKMPYSFHYEIGFEFQVDTFNLYKCVYETDQNGNETPSTSPLVNPIITKIYRLRTSIALYSRLNNSSIIQYKYLPFNEIDYNHCKSFNGNICTCFAKFKQPLTIYDDCSTENSNINLQFCIESTVINGKTQCQLCEPLYDLTNNGLCIYTIEHYFLGCYMSHYDFCIVCKEGHYWDGNICSSTVDTNKIANCKYHYAASDQNSNLTDMCYMCDSNYALDNTSKTCITAYQKYCRILDSNNSLCEECLPGSMALIGNAKCEQVFMTASHVKNAFFFKILNNYNTLWEEFSSMGSERFFMQRYEFSTALNLDLNCGWGNKAFWIQDVEKNTARCTHCITNTQLNYLGKCSCVAGGYQTGIVSFKLFNLKYLSIEGITSEGFLYQTGCTLQSELSQAEVDLYCYIKYSNIINDNTVYVIIEKTYRLSEGDDSSSLLDVHISLSGSENFALDTKCVKKFSYGLFSWIFGVYNFGYTPYLMIQLTSSGYLTNPDPLKIRMTVPNYNYNLFLELDQTDPFKLYALSSYIFLFTFDTGSFIGYNRNRQNSSFLFLTKELIGIMDRSSKANIDNQYQSSYYFYDIIDGSQSRCNGCMLQVNGNDFTQGTMLLTNLYKNANLNIELRSHNLKQNQIVYLKYVNLSRNSVRNNMLPNESICNIRPNAYYGDTNEVDSQYNIVLSTERCYHYEIMENNQKGGVFKVTIPADFTGLMKFQMDLNYSAYHLSLGAKNKKIYFQILVRSDMDNGGNELLMHPYATYINIVLNGLVFLIMGIGIIRNFH